MQFRYFCPGLEQSKVLCLGGKGGGGELFYVIHIPLQCFSCFSLVYLHICVSGCTHAHLSAFVLNLHLYLIGMHMK